MCVAINPFLVKALQIGQNLWCRKVRQAESISYMFPQCEQRPNDQSLILVSLV